MGRNVIKGKPFDLELGTSHLFFRMSIVASPATVQAVLASLGRPDIPVARGIPQTRGAVAILESSDVLDLDALARAAPLCVVLVVSWREDPLIASYPRRDGIPALPATIVGTAEHASLVAAASRLSGVPARLVPGPDSVASMPAPLIRLVDRSPLQELAPDLRRGTVLLCPRTGATFCGEPVVSARAGEAGATAEHVLAVLLAEPAARRPIIEAQWRAVRIARDPLALRGALKTALDAADTVDRSHRESTAAPPTIVIEGSIGSSFSLATVNRNLGRALARRGFAVELRSSEGEVGDFNESEAIRRLGADLAALYRLPDAPRPEPSSCAILRLMYPPRADDFAPAALHLYSAYAWEETEFPRRWAQVFNRTVDAITVLSAHVARCLRAAGYRGPILVAGCGTDHVPQPSEQARERARALLARLPRQFTFLHVSSALPRKGIDVLLSAWRRLVRRPDWRANLVLKTQRNEHNRVAEELARLGLDGPTRAPVLEIQDELDDETMAALYAEVDALVQPTRCEGLGLPMAEGILAGKPVIATAWSAHAEFCTAETAWPVAWTYRQARTHLSGHLSAWAEPDLDDLVAKMIEVHKAPREEILRRTGRGKRILERFYTWDEVADRTIHALSAARSEEFRAKCLAPLTLSVVSTWNVRCGIADYAAKQVSAFSPSQLRIVADERPDRLYRDDETVRRVWRIGHGGNVEPILEATAGTEAVCIQFTFGLIDLAELARLVRALTARGQAVIVVLHSTEDRRTVTGTVSLRSIVNALSLADLILVHTIADLERLRGFGLIDNVALFPHGVPVHDPAQPPPENLRIFRQHHDRLLAAFGYMLPHKGFRELVHALPEARRLAHTAGLGSLGLLLLTARYPSEASAVALDDCRRTIHSLGLDRHVLLVSDHTPEAEALAALSMADLLVYPYQHSQESSSAAVRFGLATGRPVAVADIPIFADLGDAVFRLAARSGSGLAVSLIDILRTLAADTDVARQVAKIRAAWVEAHRWDKLAERFHDIVHGLVCERRLGGPWAHARKTSLWRVADQDETAAEPAKVAIGRW